MREPDCILIRVGEAALKSEQVQEKWAKILKENITAALEAAGIKPELEANPNRVFVYTSEHEQALRALSKVFGITSMSPVWMCASRLDDIRNLATDIAKEILELTQEGSFAIRAHRAGRHKFTSKTVAEEAGAAVRRVTGAKVDLKNPKNEIEIEVRSRRSYVMVERVAGPGGLPLGSGGRVLALVANEQDALAAWLIAKRGVELAVLVWKGAKELAERLCSWHTGRVMKIWPAETYIEGDLNKVSELVNENRLKAAVMGEITAADFGERLESAGLFVLRPLVGTSGEEIKNMLARAGLY